MSKFVSTIAALLIMVMLPALCGIPVMLHYCCGDVETLLFTSCQEQDSCCEAQISPATGVLAYQQAGDNCCGGDIVVSAIDADIFAPPEHLIIQAPLLIFSLSSALPLHPPRQDSPYIPANATQSQQQLHCRSSALLCIFRT
jgi:hypothetical protein